MHMNGLLNNARVEMERFESTVSEIDNLVDEDALDDDVFSLDTDKRYVSSSSIKKTLK